MNSVGLAYESPGRASRARNQRAMGTFIMVLLLAFVLLTSVFAVSEVDYRGCLSKHDSAYAQASGLDKITWAPSKSDAATKCEATNRVQNLYLR
jgi:hypothetical protein